MSYVVDQPSRVVYYGETYTWRIRIRNSSGALADPTGEKVLELIIIHIQFRRLDQVVDGQ